MPTYEEIRAYRNRENKYAGYLNIETTEIGDGYARSILHIQPDFCNNIGSLHGGAIFSLADISTGAAASSGNWRMTTLNSSMNYLKAVINVTELISDARRVKKGKTIEVYEADVKDLEGNLYATGTFTYYNLHKILIEDED